MFARPGEAHQVPHGEKIRFVVQLGDQLQLVLDQLPHFVRHAVADNARRAPSQVSRVRYSSGVSPGGASSSGYSYRSSSSENVQRSAISTVRRNRLRHAGEQLRAFPAAISNAARHWETAARRPRPPCSRGESRSAHRQRPATTDDENARRWPPPAAAGLLGQCDALFQLRARRRAAMQFGQQIAAIAEEFAIAVKMIGIDWRISGNRRAAEPSPPGEAG